MATSVHGLTPEQLPAATASAGIVLSTWLRVGETGVKWALWSTVIVSGLVGLENDLGLGRLASFVVMAFLGFAFVSLGDGLVSLLWKLLGFLLPRVGLAAIDNRLHAISTAMLGRVLGISLYIAGDLLWPESFFHFIRMPPVGEIAIVLVGISGVLVAFARLPRRSTQSQSGLLGMVIVLNVAFLTWVFLPGTDNYLAHTPALATSASLLLANPGLPGPYSVQTLTYGSGSDRHRPEFAAEAALRTASVDGAGIFAGYPGLAGNYFRWYWGFDFTRLPLNGLVWYPEGEGPFPLALIVHGNHSATEASDPGYRYLAEHLASRGYIVVLVDENFLNGMLFVDGEMEEVPLRAWLMLKHLQAWQRWQETPGNPFYGRVDLQRVALIGHSRGGEAVAVAAAMKRQAISEADDFGFDIKAVVAVAPSDGHYQPAPNVSHSDYLLLAGGHDADTYLLYGQAQYNRVHFRDNPDGFKALAYLYRANHGQFNTVWANRDRGWLNSLLLNRQPLLSGDDQRQSAKVFITAFLEASLRGQEGYRSLFANPTAGNGWLPAGIVLTQYDDASFVAVDTNRPNTVASQVDRAGGRTWAREITTWGTAPLLLRDGTTSQQNHALYLSWESGSEPAVGIVLGERLPLSPAYALAFALAPASDEITPIDVIVELETTGGQVARLPLSHFGPVYPPLPAQLLKADWLRPLPGYEIGLETEFERVLQTYTLPLTAFQEVNPAWLPGAIESIRFLFDGTSAGALYLDQVGFARTPAFYGVFMSLGDTNNEENRSPYRLFSEEDLSDEFV